MVKESQTSCSCGDLEVNYLLFCVFETLSLWVGWVYSIVGFIEGGGFGVFWFFFVRVGIFVRFGGCVSYGYLLCFTKSLFLGI